MIVNRQECTAWQMGREKDMGEIKGGLRGIITIEMSYIMSVILLMFILIIYTIFYFHDKNIIIGAAAETAVLGAQMERKPDEGRQTDLNAFYRQRISGKLILFAESPAEVEITEKRVLVSIMTNRGKMSLKVQQQAPVLKPEKKIRKKRLLEELIGEEKRGE